VYKINEYGLLIMFLINIPNENGLLLLDNVNAGKCRADIHQAIEY